MVVDNSAEALALFGREYMLEMLETMDEPRSARELHEELGVPIATCHRRLEALSELGFLEGEKMTRDRDKRNRMVYTRSVDFIKFDFEQSTSMETRDVVDSLATK